MFFRLLAMVIIFFCMMPLAVGAEEDPPLEIRPQLPENQNPDTSGYFDLTMEPGETQEISFVVTNNLEEDILLVMESGNAYSHPTGGILYVPDLISENSILLEDAVQLAEDITIEEDISIPAESSEEITVQLEAPEVEGMTFLGAVHFTAQVEEEEEEGEEDQGEAGVELETITTYSVAVQLNLPYEQPYNFSLGEAGFLPQTQMVFIEMTNDVHRIQGAVTGTYEVSDDQGNELFQGEFPEFGMAPKSEIRYQIPWESEQVEPGEYTLTMEGTAAEEAFSAEETFTIEDDAAEEAEENMPEPEAEDDDGLPIWIWISLGILLILLTFWLGRKFGNKSK
ncbi:WxL protein peptidoglycan domain-containing protein [Sinobaca sp. H24]|uniref:WxL protein peptidoglycan domain-containing protein n=1 Tax=Sinobaca sp. H24 TaxID=2923376 RepID=UPI00207A5593|nr:DUF916 domain-containing protein [Sinobaca sp. H24]